MINELMPAVIIIVGIIANFYIDLRYYQKSL